MGNAHLNKKLNREELQEKIKNDLGIYNTKPEFDQFDSVQIPFYKRKYKFIRRDAEIRERFRLVNKYELHKCIFPKICMADDFLYEYDSNNMNFITATSKEKLILSVPEIDKKIRTCEHYMMMNTNRTDVITKACHANLLIFIWKGENEIEVANYDPHGNKEFEVNAVAEDLVNELNKLKGIKYTVNDEFGCNEGIQAYTQAYDIGFCAIFILFALFISITYEVDGEVDEIIKNTFGPRELYNIIVNWTNEQLKLCSLTDKYSTNPLNESRLVRRQLLQLRSINEQVKYLLLIYRQNRVNQAKNFCEAYSSLKHIAETNTDKFLHSFTSYTSILSQYNDQIKIWGQIFVDLDNMTSNNKKEAKNFDELCESILSKIEKFVEQLEKKTIECKIKRPCLRDFQSFMNEETKNIAKEIKLLEVNLSETATIL